MAMSSSKTRVTKKTAASPRKAAKTASRAETGGAREDFAAASSPTDKLAAETASIPTAVGNVAGRAVRSAADAGGELISEGMQLGMDAARAVTEKMQDTAQSAVYAVQDATQAAVQDATQAAGDAVEAGKKNLARQIKRNPVAATIAALGIGFVAGVAGRK